MGSKAAITMATTLMLVAFVVILTLCVIGPALEKVETGDSVGVDVNISEDVQEALDNASEIVQGAEEAINDATDAAVDAASEIVPTDIQKSITDIIKDGDNEK